MSKTPPCATSGALSQKAASRDTASAGESAPVRESGAIPVRRCTDNGIPIPGSTRICTGVSTLAIFVVLEYRASHSSWPIASYFKVATP